MRHSNAKKTVDLRSDATGEVITVESTSKAAEYLGLGNIYSMLYCGSTARNGWQILRVGTTFYPQRVEVRVVQNLRQKQRPGEHPSWRGSPPVNPNPNFREGRGYEPHMEIMIGTTAGRSVE